MYSSNTSPAQAQDEDIYPRRLRQLLGRGWVTVHGPEFRKKPFSWQKCLSGVGGSLTRFAPGAAAVPRPADPSPTPAGVKLAAGGGTGAPGRLGAPARVPRRRLPWLPRNIYFHSLGSRDYRPPTESQVTRETKIDPRHTESGSSGCLGCAPAGKARRCAPESPRDAGRRSGP